VFNIQIITELHHQDFFWIYFHVLWPKNRPYQRGSRIFIHKAQDMVRNNLKVALFLLISVACYFFLFQNQLLHPPTLPPIRIPPKHDTNNSTIRYYIEGGIVFGTVLKSPNNNAKTTILSLANRLIEGYVIKDATDWLTLAVYDVFGAMDEHEIEMIEDEKKIKIIVFPMKKSYDPCLILTDDEVILL
jgi:hypothetical protein